MSEQSVYFHEAIESISAEVDRQWQYHLLSRAAFPWDIGEKVEWESSAICPVRLKVSLDDPLSVGVQDIGHWLNQNYVVRLFGILNEHGVITAGKAANNSFTSIVAGLRHRVGTHSSGYWKLDSGEDRELTRLIKEQLDPSVDDEAVRRFNLSIDTVLKPLTEGCLSFVRSLDGLQKQKKESSCQKVHPIPCPLHPS